MAMIFSNNPLLLQLNGTFSNAISTHIKVVIVGNKVVQRYRDITLMCDTQDANKGLSKTKVISL